MYGVQIRHIRWVTATIWFYVFLSCGLYLNASIISRYGQNGDGKKKNC